MKLAAVRRILGLSTGAALITAGVSEIAISRSDLESPKTQFFCRLGFCADQFSVERIFELAQKAALGDSSGELEDFKRAIRLSPASAYRWADLADAEFKVRDLRQAEYASAEALKAAPRSPVILMRAANLYFQIGDRQQVLRNLALLLSDRNSYNYYDTAFLTYSRLGLPIAQILEQGVPPQAEVVSRLLSFWTKMNRVEEAIATWKWAAARSLADRDSTFDFFTFLIKVGDQPLAQQLWIDYASRRDPGYRTVNWIYNPGFEEPLERSPFDWNIDQRQDVESIRMQDVTHSGHWALRIRFNGEANTIYYQTYQEMVLPAGRYRITAMLKTDQVTTDEGIRLHVFDKPNDAPNQTKLNIWTDTVIRSHDWKQVEANFDLPAGISLVRVEIGRRNSAMFDNKIGGTSWIDDVQLSRQ